MRSGHLASDGVGLGHSAGQGIRTISWKESGMLMRKVRPNLPSERFARRIMTPEALRLMYSSAS